MLLANWKLENINKIGRGDLSMGKTNRKKSKKKLFIFGGLGLLLLIVILLVLFSGDKETIVSVQTEKVTKRNITQIVSANGTIDPVEKVELRPEVTGEIVELPVKEGDRVKKGQLLIRLKPDQYIARRNVARASLNLAEASLREREATLAEVEANYNRTKELYEKKLSSDSDLEAVKSAYIGAKSRVEAQKASVQQAQENFNDAVVELDKTAIYAPLDGTVSALNVEKSERVLGSSFSQGTHLMTVADLSKMEAIVEVDENDVVLISIGDTATIEIDAFGEEKFTGVVTQIGNSAKTSELGTQNEVVNFDVEIRLLNPSDKIRPGMSCDADIKTETRKNVNSVPIQAVSSRMPKPKMNDDKKSKNESKNADENKEKMKPVEVVFIEEGNIAKMVEVKTGISDDAYMEISSGLKEGQMIISGPYKAISKELSDSSKVKITNKRGGNIPENEEESN
ncbi:MAG: efflux RND transporter periplasmic adaptor subunit [Ignavibacteriae bacterium]|nr:efflux RND transporter periplasmic adaptor subunit [Ignavibacteriota bacterium]